MYGCIKRWFDLDLSSQRTLFRWGVAPPGCTVLKVFMLLSRKKASHIFLPKHCIRRDMNVFKFRSFVFLKILSLFAGVHVFSFSLFLGFRLETCRLRFSMFRCWKAFQNGLRSSLQASTQTIGLAAGTKPGNGNENVGNAALRIFFVKKKHRCSMCFNVSIS